MPDRGRFKLSFAKYELLHNSLRDAALSLTRRLWTHALRPHAALHFQGFALRGALRGFVLDTQGKSLTREFVRYIFFYTI